MMNWMEIMSAGWLQYILYDDAVREMYSIFTDSNYDEYISLLIESGKEVHIYRGVLYRRSGFHEYFIVDENGSGVLEHYVWSMGVYGVQYRQQRVMGEDLDYLISTIKSRLDLDVLTVYKVVAELRRIDRYIYDIEVDGNTMNIVVNNRYTGAYPDEKIIYALAIISNESDLDVLHIERNNLKYIMLPVIYSFNMLGYAEKNVVVHYSLSTLFI